MEQRQANAALREGFFIAMSKKGIILYRDLLPTVNKLTDEQAGKLLKIILDYANGNEPVIDDFLIEVVFEPIKQTIIRDSAKYEARCEKNRKNIEKRWNTNVYDGIQPNTKRTNKDKGKDKEKDKDKGRESKDINAHTREDELFDLPWSESGLEDYDTFVAKMKETGDYREYADAGYRVDFKHYHAVISEWAINGGHKKMRWVPFCWGWIRRDRQNGKIQIIKPRIAL